MRTKDPRGRSLIVIKHVRLGNHQASVCLEKPFWIAIKQIAAAQGSSMARLIGKIDSERRERLHKNLCPLFVCSSSITTAIDAALSRPNPVAALADVIGSHRRPRSARAFGVGSRRAATMFGEKARCNGGQ